MGEKYLPPDARAARNAFEEELCAENEGNWAELRILLAKKEYAALNEKLLKNCEANKKRLRKPGIALCDFII